MIFEKGEVNELRTQQKRDQNGDKEKEDTEGQKKTRKLVAMQPYKGEEKL